MYNPGLGGYGGGYGVGYGAPMGGYGAPMGGYGMPMGGMAFQGRYMFNAQSIEAQAFRTFMKYDFNRSGTLSFNELRLALNEFLMLNGQMPIMEPDLMMLMATFDVDGSGSLDFFEYKMLLEQLGGIRFYTRDMIMASRAQRAMRMNQYFGMW